MFWKSDPIGSWLRVRIYFGRSRARRYTDRPSDKLFSIRHSRRSEALQRLVRVITPCGEKVDSWTPFRYGLGTCYLRMNKVRMAEYHYRKAAEIHPTNAILIGCIGLVSRFSFLVSPAVFHTGQDEGARWGWRDCHPTLWEGDRILSRKCPRPLSEGETSYRNETIQGKSCFRS